MTWFKQHPFFGAALALCVLAAGLEAAWLTREFKEARRGLRLLAQQRQERNALSRQQPAPSRASQQAIEAELKATEELLAEMRTKWSMPEASEAVDPIDVYFAISNFVAATRAQASARQAGVKPDEYFGLASYRNGAPEVAGAAAIERQRLVLQEIMNALLASNPHELRAVRRERIGGADAVRSGDAAGANDFFSPAVPSRAAITGVARTQAFLVEFTGQTPALRDFLTGLADSRLPLSVRCLSVEPVAATKVSLQPDSATDRMVVDPSFSKFSVTVDIVELLPTGGALQ